MAALPSLRKNRAKHGYDVLENRRLLAGNVTVFETGHLFIRGDASDNRFELVVVEDGIQINGLDGTTVNQQSSYQVKNGVVTESGIEYAGGIRAHLGPGHDDFRIRDAVFSDESIVFGGTGNDAIEVIDSQFRDQVTIQTYDGDDDVLIEGSRFEQDVYTVTLDGRDTVSSIDSVFDGYSIVLTGNHSDSIHSQSNHYLGGVSLILSQDGNDEIQLNNPVVGTSQLGVFAGNHQDTIHGDMTGAIVESAIRISGQAGFDASPGIDGLAARDDTEVWSIEKGELVFESALDGAANVTEGATTYITSWPNEGKEDDVYIEQYATPVTLESTQDIQLIEWSGSYVRDYVIPSLGEVEDRFVIEIFKDAGDGAPDVSSVTRFEVGDANRVEVGFFTDEYYGDATVYGYHAEVDFTMEAGIQYFVSIYTVLETEAWVEQNHWEWGTGVVPTSETTLFNQGYEGYENDFRWHDRPYAIHGVEMDLRLRTGSTI